MTRLQILNAIKRRLNKSTTDTASDTRLLDFINETHRTILSGAGMEKLRRTTTTFPSVASTPNYTVSSVARINRVWETTNQRRLDEMSLDQYRSVYPDPTNFTGTPSAYAWATAGVSDVTLFLAPCPASVVTYTADVLSVISDLAADATEPMLPLDYHDLLVDGGLMREYEHLADDRFVIAARRFDKREKQLKYWLAETDTGIDGTPMGRSMFNGGYYPVTRW